MRPFRRESSAVTLLRKTGELRYPSKERTQSCTSEDLLRRSHDRSRNRDALPPMDDRGAPPASEEGSMRLKCTILGG